MLLKAVPVVANANFFSLKDLDMRMFSKLNNDNDSKAVQGKIALKFLAECGMSSNENSQRYVITTDNTTGAGDVLKLQQAIGPNQPICVYSSTIAVGTKGLG